MKAVTSFKGGDLQMRDELGGLYTDELFTELYSRGCTARLEPVAFSVGDGDAICGEPE